MSSTPLPVRHVLPGGTLLTLPDASFPLVRFVVALRTGAAYDGPGKSGAHRLMMELLLRGTQRQSRLAFNTAVEEMGSGVDSSMGSELGFVRGAALKRHLRATFELAREAILSPAFDGAELGRLQEEAIDGLLADRDDDDSVAEHFLRRALYANHPLGNSPAGEVPDLQALTPKDVHEAYGQWHAGNVLVAFAGDITPEEAEALAAPLLAALPPAPAARAAMAPPAAAAQPRIVVVDKPARTQVQLRVAHLGPNGQAADIEAFWLGVMAFGGTFTSPFTKAIRDDRGWSYTAHADFRRRALYPAPVVLRSAPALEDVVDCLEVELGLYREFAGGTLAHEPLDLARQYVLNRYPFEVATAFDMLGSAISHEILGLPLDHAVKLPDRLRALDLGTVPQAVARHLRPDYATALLVAPAKSVVPQLQARFAGIALNVVDFREGLGLNNAA